MDSQILFLGVPHQIVIETIMLLVWKVLWLKQRWGLYSTDSWDVIMSLL